VLIQGNVLSNSYFVCSFCHTIHIVHFDHRNNIRIRLDNSHTYKSNTLTTFRQSSSISTDESDDSNDDIINEKDTIRIRIWQALSSSAGKELSMKQLGMVVGERRISDLKFHLTHVEKQAKTFGNKSKEWKERRGINENIKQVKLKIRPGGKGMIYIKLNNIR